MITCRGLRKTGNVNSGLEEWNFVADDDTYTDKKENKISLICKGSSAKLSTTDDLLVYGEKFAHFLIY